ncbi:uncharacterized protein B0H18DRAFT_955247 [Fomitopsis serialis]|uniref:uncharacterized protein n=1 Tax=Fomitopsis serialis TaxID=139415 RepID=UPI002007690D|nr:uncharacterized protein B0H18DRAFT_955247 [Neoantrodia serialis]KAH9925202.1 hypothetical protein B0H18DRAFT_955247 [Neoantrodia serialis]
MLIAPMLAGLVPPGLCPASFSPLALFSAPPLNPAVCSRRCLYVTLPRLLRGQRAAYWTDADIVAVLERIGLATKRRARPNALNDVASHGWVDVECRRVSGVDLTTPAARAWL